MFSRRTISNDSRTFRRAKAFGIIKYSIPSDPTRTKILVNPKSICAGGALFLTHRKLSKGTVLDIELYLPPLTNFFSIVASVVDSIKIENREEYSTRVKFTAIDPEDRTAINYFVDEMARDPGMSKYLDKKGIAFKRRLG